MPAHGRFVGAGQTPFALYPDRKGERVGLNWRVPALNGRRVIRHVIFDTNYWKSFVHSRLKVAMGDAGCLSIFGKAGKTDQHCLFAHHLVSEYRVTTQGNGRTLEEWKIRLSVGDNHWFDCLVGCAVAASMEAVSLAVTPSTKPAVRKKYLPFAQARSYRERYDEWKQKLPG